MGVFSDHEVSVDCPHCGKEIKEKLGRLEGDYKCPSCGGGITFNGGAKIGADADKQLDDFRRQIKSMFK